jgi:hypothetical protein
MDDGDARIAHKILIVKREKVRNAMDPHRRDQARIVHLNAHHGVRDDQATPFPVCRFAVDEKSELALDEFGPTICFSSGETKAVPIRRPRTNIPELG